MLLFVSFVPLEIIKLKTHAILAHDRGALKQTALNVFLMICGLIIVFPAVCTINPSPTKRERSQLIPRMIINFGLVFLTFKVNLLENSWWHEAYLGCYVLRIKSKGFIKVNVNLSSRVNLYYDREIVLTSQTLHGLLRVCW